MYDFTELLRHQRVLDLRVVSDDEIVFLFGLRFFVAILLLERHAELDVERRLVRKLAERFTGETPATLSMIADMATQIQASRELVYEACRLKDAGEPFGQMAAMAKLHTLVAKSREA